jgi:hypothetical protein
VIRRLVLFVPYPDDQLLAANAWCEKTGTDNLTISYRHADSPMRLLLLDGVTVRGKKRRAKNRVLTLGEVEAQASQVTRAAVATGREVINVYTGHETNRATAFSDTDAMLTMAFPGGEAVTWFDRVGGGIAPGITGRLVSLDWRTFPPERIELLNATRYLFFKKPPVGTWRNRSRVLAYARSKLAELPSMPPPASLFL